MTTSKLEDCGPSPRAEDADCGATSRIFMMRGFASAQLPLRWLGLFAQRDLLPENVELTRHGDRITARIVQSGLDDWRTDVLVEKIRSIPDTELVWMEECV